MNTSDAQKLYDLQLVTEEEYFALQQQHQQPVSLYADLHALLYSGIILFTTGAGFLIYKNIDSIGHGIIVAILFLLCLTSFVYCYKQSPGFRKDKLVQVKPMADYILLLGCLLLLTLTGYLQFEYNIFGELWGMATFVPMIILFIAAYYFDHLGVLSIAISNLAAWAGITVTPTKILRSNDFHNPYIFYTGVTLGAFLFAVAITSEKTNFKKHFSYTYRNFSVHLVYISLLAGMFYYDSFWWLWFLAIAAYTYFMWQQAIKTTSFYFFVVTMLYAYVALNYALGHVFLFDDIGFLYLCFMWFIASGIGLIKLLMHYNKRLKQHANI